MVAEFKREACVITYANGATARTAGDIFLDMLNRRAAVAVRDIAANVNGEVYVAGIFAVAKNPAQAFVRGQTLRYDISNARLDITGDFIVGLCIADAAATDTYALLELNQFNTDARMLVKSTTITNTAAAAGTASKIFDANCPSKYRVVDMWIVCKDANSGTVKLTDGTNDITNAVAHGTSDKAIVRVGTIDDAYWEIAAGGSLSVVPATGGASEVFVLLQPVP